MKQQIKIIALMILIGSTSFASNPQSDYLTKTQNFLQTIYSFDLTETPYILKGKNCEVKISGTNSYGGYDLAYINVTVIKPKSSKTFKYFNSLGSIQQPSINFKNSRLIVAGAKENCLNYDCTESEVFHEYLQADRNQISITDKEQSLLSCQL